MTTTTHDQSATATYRRNTWQEALAEYLPEHRRTPRAFTWINRLPLIAIIVAMSLLSLRLRNSAMIDEALYINLGNQYLHGPMPTGADTDYFSGAPGLYPVVAAVLDTIGGLWLVRLFSLACLIVAVICVDRTASALYRSRRVGIFAALTFALTGPVLVLGMLATFDALAIMLLAVAMMLATTRSSQSSAAAVGALLAVATLAKYATAPFALVVLGVLAVANKDSGRRVLVAAVTFAAALVVAWAEWGSTLAPGIEFSTTARTALGPSPRPLLVGTLLVTIGLTLMLAVAGAFRPSPPHLGPWRNRLLSVGLLAAGLALPLGQVRLGEGVSFGKHMAFSALFLAPLAGRELAAMSRGMLRLLPVALLSVVALTVGWSRSDALYREWVDVSPIVSVIAADPQEGRYLSSSSDVLEYYTSDFPQITWDTTFALYSAGEKAVRAAVKDGRYQMVVLRTASTGNPDQDFGQSILFDALTQSDQYQLASEPFPVRPGSDDRWLVFTKKKDQAPL